MCSCSCDVLLLPLMFCGCFSSFSLEAAFCVMSSQVLKKIAVFYINQPGPVKMIFRKKSQVSVPYHVTVCCCTCSASEARIARRVHGCGGAQNDCRVSSFCFNDRNIYTPDLQKNLASKYMITMKDVFCCIH